MGYPSWSDLNLNSQTAQALTQAGYSEPAPVQVQLIPPALRGESKASFNYLFPGLIGQSRSGSGKTVAYAATILNSIDLSYEHDSFTLKPTKLAVDPQIAVRQRLQAVVVVPTREIGVQVTAEMISIAMPLLRNTAPAPSPECKCEKAEDAKVVVCTCGCSKDSSLGIVACVGGCPLTYDLLALRVRRPQVVIFTPGRFLTLTQDASSATFKKFRSVHGSVAHAISDIKFDIPAIKMLVIDEADRLLSEAFQPQVMAIVKQLARFAPLQVLAYSATFPPPILSLVEKIVYQLVCGSNDRDLTIVVNGIDPEPGAEVPAECILRKCYLVSSFYDQAAKTTRIPLRMSLDQTISTQAIESPTHANVPCFVITARVGEQEANFVNRLCESFEAPFADKLLSVAEAFDDDFDHWPDLRAKTLALLAVLLMENAGQSQKFIVFCNDLFSGLKIAELLTWLGLPSAYVSAKVEQECRKDILQRFHSVIPTSCLSGLVCSDLLARGLDVPDVKLVISIDLPDNHHTVLHRIGRCSRFGRNGKAYFVLRKDDEENVLKLFALQTGLELSYIEEPKIS